MKLLRRTPALRVLASREDSFENEGFGYKPLQKWLSFVWGFVEIQGVLLET